MTDLEVYENNAFGFFRRNFQARRYSF